MITVGEHNTDAVGWGGGGLCCLPYHCEKITKAWMTHEGLVQQSCSSPELLVIKGSAAERHTVIFIFYEVIQTKPL